MPTALASEPTLNGVRDEAAHNRIGPPRHITPHPIDTVRRVVNDLADRVGRGPRHIVGGRDNLANRLVQIGEDSTDLAAIPASSLCHSTKRG